MKSKLFLDPTKIFERILIACEAKNAPEVGRLLGISKQAVYDWQKNTPSLDNLMRVAETRNTSLHWILTGQGERSASPKRSISMDDLLEEKIREIVRAELAQHEESVVISPLRSRDVMLAPNIADVGDDTAEDKSRKTN